MPKLTISLLGSFEVRLDGQVIQHFESMRMRALLAYLAAEAGRPKGRAALAGLLWPDWPEVSAHKNLRQALYSLRKTLKDEQAETSWIHSDRQLITFDPGGNCLIDTRELEKALNASRGFGTAADRQPTMISGPPSAVGGLQSAVDLYRGPFLDGFTLDDSPVFEEWVLNRREHHSQQMLHALSLLADWREGVGEYDKAEAYVRQQLELEPWREKAHQQLMRSLALKGERVQALAQYESLRQALKNELGVEPSAETIHLYKQIRDGKFISEQKSKELEDLLAIPKRAQHNLPYQLTSFIGREQEIAKVQELLGKHRLVTLTGSGGVGKTRLAIQAASGLVDLFSDGVWYVELAPISDPEAFLQIVFKTLGLMKERDRTTEETLIIFLRTRQGLLILDNCEHLIEECANLAFLLLRNCGSLKILASSREALNVSGEVAFSVPSMRVPDLRG